MADTEKIKYNLVPCKLADLQGEERRATEALFELVVRNEDDGDNSPTEAEITEILRNPKLRINAYNNNGNTALIWAATMGHDKIVEQLLHLLIKITIEIVQL